MDFQLVSPYKPAGDQPGAIAALTRGLHEGRHEQVLLGVTGSGKTYTMASVIAALNRPALVISHNKTLAAQLYQEFRSFFPHNAVSYFVSYYDYYQPEAYIPRTDTYIEKETEINEEIDKLRLSATANLLTRKDTLIVASVSCIYNIGSPKEYGNFVLELAPGVRINRESIFSRLIDLQYSRANFGFHRGSFRVRGESIDIFPAYEDIGIRIVMDGEKIKTLSRIDPLTGSITESMSAAVIYPAKHYMTDPKKNMSVFAQIQEDLEKQEKVLTDAGRKLEAYRLHQKVQYDLEMIQELGYVNGIENYSRYFDGRNPGDPPYSLLDYFKHPYGDDWLLFIDESHMTIPQIRGMYAGDRSRKQTLIDFGFRLPAALDNRPLMFTEFLTRMPQTMYISATPADWEVSRTLEEGHKYTNQESGIKNHESGITNQEKPDKETEPQFHIRNSKFPPNSGIVEQLIRPTGIVDPEIQIRPTQNQVLDLLHEIITRKKRGERVLVTTLTKRMAEDLSTFLNEKKYRENPEFSDIPEDAVPMVHYLHADVQTLERSDILDDLRSGKYDVVVGINLLREGLDLPEVSLVAILDADKEGFLRSDTALVQTMGRAARHVSGIVILYADTVTGSMRRAIDEIERRRKIQSAYNKTHNISPKSIRKPIRDKLVEKEIGEDTAITTLRALDQRKMVEYENLLHLPIEGLTPQDKTKLTKRMQREMKRAADELNFELAAKLRDKIKELKE